MTPALPGQQRSHAERSHRHIDDVSDRLVERVIRRTTHCRVECTPPAEFPDPPIVFCRESQAMCG
jgi:hypothetical protein